jgi:hypothetical protein
VIVTGPPTATPVTTPLCDTEAAGLELVQFSSTLDAEDGENVGSSVNDFPTDNPTLNEIPVIGLTTVTVVDAVFEPFTEIAVIVVVPLDLPVTMPFATVATVWFADVHVTDLFAALLGLNCTGSVAVWPTFTCIDEGIEID